MRFTALRDSGLGITEDDLVGLFEPFVERSLPDPGRTWAKKVARRRREILGGSLRRLTLGWLPATQRREAAVVEEYTTAWRWTDLGGRYRLPGTDDTRCKPWEWRGQRLLARDVGATRFRQLLLVRVLERLRPTSVLEVGCGNGINLILLACRFPEVAFTGLELTDAGHQAALGFQERHAALPEPMRTFAPLPLPDPGGFRRIRFVQGNAADLPFPDGAFELTFTALALEQMERLRHRALGEVARVTGGHALMIEPFRDINAAFWPRLNVLRRNYFRGRIAELPGYGLDPVLALDDFPQEIFLRVAAVISKKRAPSARTPPARRVTGGRRSPVR